jgi:hypothetical protein
LQTIYGLRKEGVMKRMIWLLALLTFALLLVTGCGSNAFKSFSDDGSDEACRYKTTMNLDKGNYDEVLASVCADSMQMGAAYFGKAGFDIKDVVNRLSEADSKADPLNIYMAALTGIITDTTIENLDSAGTQYNKITAASAQYGDAQFYKALVDAITSLSFLKIVIDSDGDGKLLTSCDLNNNNIPDDADALACTLLVNSGQNCNALNLPLPSQTPNITFAGNPGTYTGVIVTAGAATLACPGQYKKLIIQGSGVATTSARMCLGSDNNQWPCPVIRGGNPLDMANAIDSSVNSAVNALTFAFPSKATDVQNSINKIKSDKCCTSPGENPLIITTCTCSQLELSNYVQTIKK